MDENKEEKGVLLSEVLDSSNQSVSDRIEVNGASDGNGQTLVVNSVASEVPDRGNDQYSGRIERSTREDGVSHDEVGNCGIEAVVATSSAIANDLSMKVEVANETPGDDVDGGALADSKTQATAEGKASALECEEETCPDVQDSHQSHVGSVEGQNAMMACDSSQADSTLEPEMGVDTQVNKYDQECLPEEQENRVNIDLICENEVTQPVENEQQCKNEGYLSENAPCSLGKVQAAQVQVQGSPAEPLGNEVQQPVLQKSAAETQFQVTVKLETEVKDHADENQQLEFEEGVDDSDEHELLKTESDVGEDMKVEGHAVDAEQALSEEDQEMEIDEWDTDTEQVNTAGDKSTKQVSVKGTSGKVHQASYQLPADDERDFSVSDLVWGKVRSHPWWPGQIFDPSDASEKAMKYYRRDSFLVAYFGDRTFAWNEASQLKHFRSHFSQAVKQSNLESFQNAVDCALEEVSRRVEVGLACSCIPRETYDSIKFQVIENAGIRDEASTREDVDKLASVDQFEPKSLVEYLKELAQSPLCGADRLELVISRSQLQAFYRMKGFNQLTEFQFCGDIETTDALSFQDQYSDDAAPASVDEKESPQPQKRSYNKRKHNLKDSVYARKKERSLSELMVDSWGSDDIGSNGKVDAKLVSPTSSKKRKGTDYFADDSTMADRRKTISHAKGSALKPSFKIGECIRRVASQMTGPPSILKSNSQKFDGTGDEIVGDASEVSLQHSDNAELKGFDVSPETEDSSLDELLSQLHLSAQDPLKRFGFPNILVGFFSDFRNSVVSYPDDNVDGNEGKLSHILGETTETFEFNDMNDTYWTERATTHNGFKEKQPSRKSRKRDNEQAPKDPDKHSRKSKSRKLASDRKQESETYRKQEYVAYTDQSPEKPVGYVDEKAPAELVMHFPVVDSVPSETSLNKMFRRFGPLKEYETEIDRDTNRARVVFRRCADAEAAYGSASKFNIFGQMLVNYQLNYTVSTPFKTVQIVPTQSEEDTTLFLQY